VISVGEVAESLVHLKGLRMHEARERTLAALAAVKLRDPRAVYRFDGTFGTSPGAIGLLSVSTS
jgi:hypothetical protein